MASKKKSGTNLSQFVRDRPNLSPAEIVAEAEKKGLQLKVGLVYNVRATDKKAKGAAPKGKPGPKAQRAAVGGGSLDAMVRAIVAEEIKAYFARLG